MKSIRKVLLVVSATGIFAFGAAEILHHHRFGQFAEYGLHTDVILGNSDIATHDTYIANLWNLSLTLFDLEGCIVPSDVGGVTDSVLHRWDVQKRDSISGTWVYLRGADTWVAVPLSGCFMQEPCRPAMIRLAVNAKRSITVDTAMRLARYFGTSPQYWLNLQTAYDLEVAGLEILPRIEKEVLPRTAA
jgi:hypothetical protein